MGIVDTARAVFAIAQKINNLELMKEVASLQVQVLEIQDENRTFRDRVKELDEVLKFAKTLRFEAHCISQRTTTCPSALVAGKWTAALST